MCYAIYWKEKFSSCQNATKVPHKLFQCKWFELCTYPHFSISLFGLTQKYILSNVVKDVDSVWLRFLNIVNLIPLANKVVEYFLNKVGSQLLSEFFLHFQVNRKGPFLTHHQVLPYYQICLIIFASLSTICKYAPNLRMARTGEQVMNMNNWWTFGYCSSCVLFTEIPNTFIMQK